MIVVRFIFLFLGILCVQVRCILTTPDLMILVAFVMCRSLGTCLSRKFVLLTITIGAVEMRVATTVIARKCGQFDGA